MNKIIQFHLIKDKHTGNIIIYTLHENGDMMCGYEKYDGAREFDWYDIETSIPGGGIKDE